MDLSNYPCLVGMTPTKQIEWLRRQGVRLGRADLESLYEAARQADSCAPQAPESLVRELLPYANTDYQRGLLSGKYRWSGYDSETEIRSGPEYKRIRQDLLDRLPAELSARMVRRYSSERRKRVLIVEITHQNQTWMLGAE